MVNEWILVQSSTESLSIWFQIPYCTQLLRNYDLWTKKKTKGKNDHLSDFNVSKQRRYFANKGPSSQGYGFSSGPVWI